MQIALLLVACAGAVNAAAGVLEVDLVFPRNETYAPTAAFPVIFAYRNSELAPFLNTQLSLAISEGWDLYSSPNRVSAPYDMRWANFSSNDPYFELRVFTSFNKEGTWRLDWSLSWDDCTNETWNREVDVISHNTARTIMFTIKNSAQEVDLVAATNNRNCSEEDAVVINIDRTLEVPSIHWDGVGGICASVASNASNASTTPLTTPTPTPCQVKFDSAEAASMSSSMAARLCQASPNCTSTDDDKNTGQRLTGSLTAGWAAAVGALVHFLV